MAPTAVISQHPGSSSQEIDDEPNWGFGHNHRIGFLNRQDRRPGFTHDGDWIDEEDDEKQLENQAKDKINKLKSRVAKGELVNFRDLMNLKTDFHLQHPENHPLAWRFMVETTEDWVKNEQNWPANERERLKKEANVKDKKEPASSNEALASEKNQVNQPSNQPSNQHESTLSSKQDYVEKPTNVKYDQGGRPQSGTEDHWTTENGEPDDDESRWKRGQGDSKEHKAYASNALIDKSSRSTGQSDDEEKSEYSKLREKYSPQEISLLKLLQHEEKYMKNLGQNDGKGQSPVATQNELIEIDVADQFSPDNWIPRSGDLIRLTGKHPLNGEPKLSKLYQAGLITPNWLHYVRNHGAVPRLYWETHKLDVESGALVLSMHELEKNFNPINIAVALACDGNRRGELNLIRKSKGFSWGSGAISCAYWRGALLRDVLLEAGIVAKFSPYQRRYINFEGAEELSDGKYATSIPLEYAMDPANDVLIAYEMNDVRLPPDHGFPCRLIIPGYVGGRNVKWLSRIWTSDTENDSHYHIWDNRVLPSFIAEKDGDFARTMFNHPSTACMEQNLNSIIVKPSEGERISFSEADAMEAYRVEGIAYDGGGHEVQRVELSLDGGRTWLYCIRQFPDRPIRHGNRFWTWLHWYVDIDMGHFMRAESLTVRCFNVFKNTQPEHPNWNTMGMMNNCYYVVKPTLETKAEAKGGNAEIVYKHPVDPSGDGGWMEPSTEVKLQAAKQDTGVPDKQFTRQEVEKHTSESDCWIVINDKVFDATSVLDWHPGGKASILAYAGKLTQETTSSFESIHDEYATKKLNECALGKLTDKAIKFIKENAKAAAAEAAKSGSDDQDILLKTQSWVPVKLIKRNSLSQDTSSYTFELPKGKTHLGLDTCQHIQFGIHLKDRMLIRSYTPTKPVLPSDEDGTFELVVKIYLPTKEQPGGAFSNILDCLPVGEYIEVRGPTGDIRYLGNGKFDIEGQECHFSKVSLILGGSGITPGYQLMQRILRTKDDKTQLKVIDANKAEGDILLREELDKMVENAPQQCQVTHVLSHPSETWKGLKGHVSEEIIKKHCFSPEEDESAVFLCGPPTLIQKAALPALKDWGYEEEKNCFGF